ncbi:MAG: RluA family pseudouridine synthase [Bdellovibrionales bacterium]
MRLDKVLSTHEEIRTRSRAQKLIDQGWVTLNGKAVKSSRLTALGESYTIQISISSSEITPLDLALDIHYEDEHLIVINKPAGLVVHPAEGHEKDTLVNALIHHTKNLSMGFHEKRPGIVHRLDKDTSGLLVVAKNDRAHEALSEQFRQHTVHRVYQALILGVPKEQKMKIETFIGRDPRNRKKFAVVVKNGKFSSTEYRLLTSYAPLASLIELKLRTGRTHQIRVHMSSLGHPIISDPIYGPQRYDRMVRYKNILQAIETYKGIALHAGELGFVHPTTKKELQFKAVAPVSFLNLQKSLAERA